MDGGAPPRWPPDPAIQGGSLRPPGLQDYHQAIQPPPWVRRQVVFPEPFFPNLPNVGQQFRRRRQQWLNLAANTEIQERISFDIPCVVYGLTGAAVDTTGAALPVGLAPLDTFLVRFEHNTGDRLDDLEALGSALLGVGERPAYIGGPGWQFDRGGVLRIGVTPLRANLRINVVAWCVETRGPTNVGTLG